MKSDYPNQLKNYLIEILKHHPKGLKDIIKQLDGAFPSDIVAILATLKADYPELSDLILNDDIKFEIDSDSTQDKRIEWIDKNLIKLSKAHPADYDWRFTPNTADKLSELIYTKYSPKSVGLFGVTTLYMVLNHFYSEIDTYLVNKSSSLINDLELLGYNKHLINHDLFLPLSVDFKFDLIVADPPWYVDYYKAFILRASQTLKLGGYFMLSILPKLTRPNVQEDLKIIDNFCNLCGFKIVEIKGKYLTYETPDFEKKSLQENLIEITDWRYGDLMICEKIAETSQDLILDFKDSDPEWLEFSLKGKKIKISKADDLHQHFSFNYVAEHKTLPSVSRRYKKRGQINFWTSDNIAFNVTNLVVLKVFFANVSVGNTVNKSLSNTAALLNLNNEDLDKLMHLLDDAELL